MKSEVKGRAEATERADLPFGTFAEAPSSTQTITPWSWHWARREASEQTPGQTAASVFSGGIGSVAEPLQVYV